MAKKKPDGSLEPTRRWTDTGSITIGSAPLNELNWINALFGRDATGSSNGVFINRLPLINDLGLRVSLDQIARGIGNTATHEAGHALGLVPNSGSTLLRNSFNDERFSNISFDGSSSNHAGQSNSNVMAPETIPGMIFNTPPILTTNPTFRTVERSYLRAILPR